ncbi:MAG: HEAT repeat domain-containing protein [Anaerolineae bacterium]|nr:HEAT repeat domain-containing protein [Anaerolineae bacterium]
MESVTAILFWYDRPASAKELFRLMFRAAATWPRGASLRLEGKDSLITRHEMESAIAAYSGSPDESFSATITFDGWKETEVWHYEKGQVSVTLQVWSDVEHARLWDAHDERVGSRAAIQIKYEKAFLIWGVNKTDQGTQALDDFERAIAGNLAMLQDLLVWLILKTRPAMIKAFRNVECRAEHPHLIYYQNLAQASRDMQYLFDLWVLTELSLPLEHALWVTEETAEVVLKVGNFHTVPILGGYLIFSQHPYFLNASLNGFYASLLKLAKKPAKAAPATAVDEIHAILEAFWRPPRTVRDEEMHDAVERLKRYGEVALEPLIAASQHKYPAVQAVAVCALGEMRNRRATRPLLDALNLKDGRESLGIVAALGRLEDPETIQTLGKIVRQDPDAAVRVAAVESLGKFAPHAVLEPIVAAINDPHGDVWKAALRVLESWHDADLLFKAAQGRTFGSLHAAVLLGERKDKRAIGPLIRALENKEPWIQQKALQALAGFPESQVITAICDLLNDPKTLRYKELRATAIEALNHLQTQVTGREKKLITQVISQYFEIECAECRGKFMWGDGYYTQTGSCPYCGAVVIQAGEIYWEWVGENAQINAGKQIPSELPPDPDWVNDEAWRSGKVYGRPIPVKAGKVKIKKV